MLSVDPCTGRSDTQPVQNQNMSEDAWALAGAAAFVACLVAAFRLSLRSTCEKQAPAERFGNRNKAT